MLGIAAAIAIAFAAVAFFMLQALPGARTKTDYLVTGTAGTFVCLLLVFLLLGRGLWSSNLFYRRRRR
ncbi:MAG: hypothetical protein KIT09_00065 [Bryobacteraceae bacterium]|nr:hypothetical protein [Bryobacteraceae bacterium]